MADWNQEQYPLPLPSFVEAGGGCHRGQLHSLGVVFIAVHFIVRILHKGKFWVFLFCCLNWFSYFLTLFFFLINIFGWWYRINHSKFSFLNKFWTKLYWYIINNLKLALRAGSTDQISPSQLERSQGQFYLKPLGLGLAIGNGVWYPWSSSDISVDVAAT